MELTTTHLEGLLLLLIVATWWLWVVAAAASKAATYVRRGTPPAERGGMSLLPVIPVVPLVLFGGALAVDAWWAPWGSLAVGGLHLALAATWSVGLVRDLRVLREDR